MPPEATIPERTQDSEPTPTTDLIPRDEVATRLLNSGMDAAAVSSILNMSPARVERVRTTTTTTFSNPKDSKLADEMRDIVREAQVQAKLTLEYGSPAERHSLVKALMGRAVALIGIEQSSFHDEMRGVLNDLMSGMRDPALPEFDLPIDLEAPKDDEALATRGDSLHH